MIIAGIRLDSRWLILDEHKNVNNQIAAVLPSPQLMLANLHKRCRCQILIGPCKVSTLKWTINTAQAGGHETQYHTHTSNYTDNIG